MEKVMARGVNFLYSRELVKSKYGEGGLGQEEMERTQLPDGEWKITYRLKWEQ